MMEYSGYSQYLSDNYRHVCKRNAQGDSDLYYCTDEGLIYMSPCIMSSMVTGPVPIMFPDPDPQWFFEGYPEVVEAGEAMGSLVDYVAVSFYARQDGHIFAGFDPIDIYDGYINDQGQYVKDIQIDKDYRKGDFVFAILLNKYAGAAQYTMIRDNSTWGLLSEVSNVLPGQEVTKMVSVTSGVTTEESKTFATTVGATIGFKAGVTGAEVTASLTTSLTQSFKSSVAYTTEITVTDSITFPAQPREQRVAIYQFIQDYDIIPGGPLMGWRDYLNGTSTDEAKFFSSKWVCNVDQAPPFRYPSRYFATSFVLEPE